MDASGVPWLARPSFLFLQGLGGESWPKFSFELDRKISPSSKMYATYDEVGDLLARRKGYGAKSSGGRHG